jgi:hypothetical protein
MSFVCHLHVYVFVQFCPHCYMEILETFRALLGGIYYNYCLRSCKSVF